MAAAFVIGSHVSMRAPDYLLGSVREALGYGADALMVYTGPPQSARRTPTAKLRVDDALKEWRAAGKSPAGIVVHAPYIVNLASADDAKRRFGIDFIASELDRAAAFGAPNMVLHPGSAVGSDPDSACARLTDSLNAVLKKSASPTVICLETMAGKGNEIGVSFAQLAKIMAGVSDRSRIGVCLDTCHVHDAGHDVSDAGSLLAAFEAEIGLSRLRVVHLNDSLNARGARRDRHANVGKGKIGLEALARVCARPELRSVPFILETPYEDDRPPYAREIALLRRTVASL